MMTFFHSTKAAGTAKSRYPTLEQRRRSRTIRSLAIALCAGIAVFLALQSMAGMVATKPVATAAHDIAKGSTIDEDDIEIVQVPESKALASALSSRSQATGTIAQVDIASGDILTRPMARASPVPAEGMTVIDVAVVSAGSSLFAGERVSLVTSGQCTGGGQPGTADQAQQSAAQDETNGDAGSSGEASQPQDSCMLAKDVVIVKTSRDSMDQDIETATHIQVALSPQEAATVIAAKEGGPIMVITRK
ncbi:SAF domain-containing protein [Bifidobacterium sp. ESL0790]|uniref:SAF domain-containing protein n=1 Tax=Bifidobacterium sp. ESL0790 TaxID=2983233 RepID=UPI0023F8B491|nr:SAF domain-containing protein [Bifidobacterium sp. ESL0790]WEV72177.1 SAF domain-containing protein [Bifidobacterium sp. ESL0790]